MCVFICGTEASPSAGWTVARNHLADWLPWVVHPSSLGQQSGLWIKQRCGATITTLAHCLGGNLDDVGRVGINWVLLNPGNGAEATIHKGLAVVGFIEQPFHALLLSGRDLIGVAVERHQNRTLEAHHIGITRHFLCF